MEAAAATHPYVREAAFVHEIAGLSDAELARATGVAPATARAWVAGTRTPSGKRAERLIELSALVERLARVIEPSYIRVWLRKPIAALADDKPLDLLARGRYRKVARVVAALEEGSFS